MENILIYKENQAFKQISFEMNAFSKGILYFSRNYSQKHSFSRRIEPFDRIFLAFKVF